VQKPPLLPLVFILLLLLTLSLPVPVEGTRFSHTAHYEVGGLIDLDKQIGDPCDTGAYKTQTVKGYGEMTKSEEIDIAPNIMAVDDEMNWFTAEDAIRNLEVTATIELCARPLSAAAEVYDDYDYAIDEGDIISPYHPLVVDGKLDVTSKTTQTWGIYVTTDQGEEGAYVTDFIAAYGPGPYDEDFHDGLYSWEYDREKNDADDYGDRYVGNYFDIDSELYTSGGVTRRYISMSSPFSYAVLDEQLDVVGMTEITETFSMDNLEPGPDAITLAWHELF